MADESQVEAAIVTMLSAILYPSGTSQPSLLNTGINIERGWPTEADVRAAVKTNLVLIRVHAVGGFSKDETRFPRSWLDQPVSANTLTATLNGFAVTFGGTPAVGQFIGVTSAEVGYAYAVASSDTLVSIASNLAAEIPGANASGAILTLPTAATLPVVTLTEAGNSMLEPARAVQIFAVATWSPTPALRDSVMQLIFPQAVSTYRLVLADASIATLMDIQTTGPDDIPGRAGEWRRDLRLTYDYPVAIVQYFPPVTIPILGLTATIKGPA
jgi:hypothetical protein